VVAAARRQLGLLAHGMGDVHPHPPKADLLRELSRITFERWTAGSARPIQGRTILGNSGFEAVEAALKTAYLATGRRGVMAFEGAYHGTGYGALNATHRDHFRGPFRAQLGEFGTFAPFPRRNRDLARLEEVLARRLRRRDIGAVIAEPIQGRGGIRVPPDGFLRLLRSACDAHGALLILDEVFTGCGRTGAWFACEHEKVVPDLICLGKALTGGFPLAACVGRAELMAATWPRSAGEAIHTSTFLGHPVGCAMALAQLDEIRRLDLVKRSRVEGQRLLEDLHRLGEGIRAVVLLPRGRGLMVGIEFERRDARPAAREVWSTVLGMMARGFLVLPEGEHGEVLGLTPPLTIGRRQLSRAVEALDLVLRAL
jgi:4-aminobutyrate aminotransferase/(S)-3-amino-2-methylpropionate transaminase